ncbi:YNFM family putative membrane transporter [Paenibacillus sp. V4I3]|uniref:MFS transporter n=1 Tax=unclassified Paenibacillus TaxID=185978 RepID=UPI00064679B1|nr:MULTISPECIES: MFS transporter [unclassified Paenibacillus]MDQ0877621.1 YNFM family putative membrane transporter [Paenibacillus sp. V4I3]MDQ0886506.1 YNFM family putative membrane transporter [Paenibacillus sp. V4I9]
MANEPLDNSSNFSLITGILFWCALVVVSCVYLTIPLITIISDVFKVSSSQAAWAGSAFSFAFAGGGLFFGVLSDRYGRKKMMLSGLLLLTVITPLIGSVSSFSWLVALRAFQGLAASMFPPSVLAYAMEMFPIKRRVTIIGFISTAFLMATIVGQIYSSFIVLNFSFSYVFYLLFAVYLISFILIIFFIPKDKTKQPDGSFFSPFLRIGDIFKRKGLPLCYIISATLFISLVGFFTTLGSYLNSSLFGLSHQDILWVRAVGIIGMLVAPFDGRLVAKFGVKNVLWCGLIFAGIGLGLLGLWANLIFLVSMSVVFITGIALALPALISLIGHIAGEIRAIAVSFHMFMVFIGASLGPILSIYLINHGGHLLAFEVLAGLLCLSLIVPFLIRIEE